MAIQVEAAVTDGLLRERQGLHPDTGEVFFYLSFACNLRCLHCYVRPRLDENVHASWPLIEEILCSCRRPGVEHLILLGGEPTLHPDFPLVLREAIAGGIPKITVDTNGVAHDPAPVEANERLCVRLSIEGPDRSTHEAVRPPGSFLPAMARLDSLVRRGVTVYVTCTIHAFNYQRIESFVAFLASRGVAQINFHFLSLDRVALQAGLALPAEKILAVQHELERLAPLSPVPLRFPRLLVRQEDFSQEVARGCRCLRSSLRRVLIAPSGRQFRCPFDLARRGNPLPAPSPFQGCPLAHRLFPQGTPNGYQMTCISWKPGVSSGDARWLPDDLHLLEARK